MGGVGNANGIANVLVTFSSSVGASNFQPSNAITNALGVATTSITSLIGGLAAQAYLNITSGTGDFNGDGIYDVVVPDYGVSKISVLIGTSSGHFAPL